jgi:hypothetical protein
VGDALLDERRELTEWAIGTGIFTIRDVGNRAGAYTPIRRIGPRQPNRNVTKPGFFESMLFRAAFIATAIATAAIGSASLAHADPDPHMPNMQAGYCC